MAEAVSVAEASTPAPSRLAAPVWLPSIEVLRGVAALSVVMHHTWGLTSRPKFFGYQIVEGFGSWGVDLFFVLSGYLLCEWYWRDRPGSTPSFLVRRFFRIAPAYYFNMVVLFVFFAVHGQVFSEQGVKQVASNLTFTHQMFPGTVSSLNVNGAWWTLSVEMVLYLAMPLMALSMRRRPWIGAAALVVLGTAWILMVARAGEPLRQFVFGSDPVPFSSIQNHRLYLARWFPGHLALFAIGMITRRVVMERKLPRWAFPASRRPSVIVIGVLLVPSLWWLYFIERASDSTRWIWFSGYHVVLALLFVPVIIYASSPAPEQSVSPIGRVGVWLGARSYGIYLWHFPVVLSVFGRGAAMAAPNTEHAVSKVAIVLVVSIFLGAVSYSAIEEPARKYGQRLSRRLDNRRYEVVTRDPASSREPRTPTTLPG